MIFGFLLKKKIVVPLDAGEVIELVIPGEKENRVLYAKVAKVSKKKNVFVHFIPKKEADLQVGTGGTLTAIHQRSVIQYATRLLHVKEDLTFIFSPPDAFLNKKIPDSPETLTYNMSLPIEYRAMASVHTQKGTLVEFSPDSIVILVNLPIPAPTVLSYELPLPWKENPVRVKGKVISCEKSQKDPKKHLVRTSLDEFGSQDRETLLWYCVLRGAFPDATGAVDVL